jgi:glycosyltransferase involved in cell wall biosynthesis
MNNEKIKYRWSVLMPVYNAEQYVIEAFESILNQTLQDFEFIIVNDGSTDGTPEILNEYAQKDSRIKVIHQSNGGIVSALNRGLSEARGEWIFRMDGDDIALPHRFTEQTEMIKNNPSLVLLGGWCQQIDADKNILKINKYSDDHNRLVSALEKMAPFFPHSTACFRRDVVMGIGGYRERFRHAEDYDLWLRLSMIGKLSCCKSVVLKLRKHAQNISNRDVGYGNVQQITAVAAEICHFSRKSSLPDPSQMEAKSWEIFFTWVMNRMHEKNYFKKMQGWEILRNIWFTNQNVSKPIRSLLMLQAIVENHSLGGALWWKLRKDAFVLKLNKESRIILQKLIT